jgi:Glutathione S-transferase, N-terminal domain
MVGRPHSDQEDEMAVKLHRCSNVWVKVQGHPCWKVQSALDEAGIEYEIVKGPLFRSKRTELEAKSGQRLYPVLEFEDGSIYREQSTDMAAAIKTGKLDEKRGAASG